MKKQIIITGDLGFIGQHLVKRLIKENFYPIIIDDLSVGNFENLRLLPKSKFIFLKCNITNRARLEKNIARFKPNTIIHLAALHFIPDCNQNPSKTLLTNVVGTQILLDIAHKRNIKNFLFTSSAAVYKPSRHPYKETGPLCPIDIYGLSKKAAEELVQLYGKYHNIKFIILRLFNVYGLNDPNLHIIPLLLSQLKKSERIRVGRLDTFRDYIYIDDVIEVLVKILKSRRGFDNSIYNIGTGKKYSGHSLIKMISKITGRKILTYRDKNLIRAVDRKILVANIKKFSKAYSWKPKYNLFQGLKELLTKLSYIK
ncbi:MAG: NAD-dependent epimerase/dehydratase family protein [Minisyncoccales bacterium]